jgi:phosphohistidine phosphatase
VKHLLLVRHAKSSWDDPSMADVDRPLNDRGETDAPIMAKRLEDKKIKLEVLVTSPAKRAKQTCKYFAKGLDIKKKKIVEEQELYEAGPENFYHVIESFKNKWDDVAIFSHNPGITSFVNSLTDTHIDDMPTCAVFAIKADVEKWKDFREAKKEFWFFDYPKNDE